MVELTSRPFAILCLLCAGALLGIVLYKDYSRRRLVKLLNLNLLPDLY